MALRYSWVVRLGGSWVAKSVAGDDVSHPPLTSMMVAAVRRELSSRLNACDRMSARSVAAGRVAFCLRNALKTALYSLTSTSALVRKRTSRAAKYWATPAASSNTASRPRYTNVSRHRNERKRDMISRAYRGATRGSCLDPVPDSPHRLDQLVLLIPQLLSQIPDVHLDVVRVAEEVIAPDLVENAITGEDLVGMHHQQPQQVELASR